MHTWSDQTVVDDLDLRLLLRHQHTAMYGRYTSKVRRNFTAERGKVHVRYLPKLWRAIVVGHLTCPFH